MKTPICLRRLLKVRKHQGGQELPVYTLWEAGPREKGIRWRPKTTQVGTPERWVQRCLGDVERRNLSSSPTTDPPCVAQSLPTARGPQRLQSCSEFLGINAEEWIDRVTKKRSGLASQSAPRGTVPNSGSAFKLCGFRNMRLSLLRRLDSGKWLTFSKLMWTWCISGKSQIFIMRTWNFVGGAGVSVYLCVCVCV